MLFCLLKFLVLYDEWLFYKYALLQTPGINHRSTEFSNCLNVWFYFALIYQFKLKHVFYVIKRTISFEYQQLMFWLRNKKTHFQ